MENTNGFKECGDGWDNLLKPIYQYVEKFNEDNPENPIEILQIKEKFGLLNVYVNHNTNELRKLISEAMNESAKTCEICGSTTNIGHTQGWIKTLCYDCVKKLAKDTGREIKWFSHDKKQNLII